ncbi:MAG: hypothetical protein K1X53_17765 [Candidatus Sumerlaeaceae bacterium]|nr:hypothetical protein [Candidatus Sumerlaeaceae bacterium]
MKSLLFSARVPAFAGLVCCVVLAPLRAQNSDVPSLSTDTAKPAATVYGGAAADSATSEPKANFASYLPPVELDKAKVAQGRRMPDARSIREEPTSSPEKVVLKQDWSKGEQAKDWDRNEYETLASDETKKKAGNPMEDVRTASTYLTIEEVLAANRPDRTIEYASTPATGSSTPPQQPVKALPAGHVQIESADYIDYDEERKFLYGRGRTVVHYGAFTIKADKVLVDTRLKEIQAQGNVILTSESDYIEAESIWVNAENGQGIAYGTRGRQGPFFFLGDPTNGDGTTTFRQVSKDEVVFKDASFTGCEFPVPFYRVHAKEFVVMNGERVFARNAVLYVREKPLLWIPYYTKSLKEKSPWGATVGDDSKLGQFVRVWYNYYYACYSPSEVDDKTMHRTSYAHMRLYSDYMSKKGWGQGLQGSYFIEDGKHRGSLDLYRVNDTDREVTGDDFTERYYVNWYNRTRLSENLNLLVNVDYASDPDLFKDILDRLKTSSQPERDRLIERSAQGALEWTADDFFAGIEVSFKDRIGRDRVNNYSDPRDNDFDYNTNYNKETFFTLASAGTGPDGNPYPAGTFTNPFSVQDDEDGISAKRYGRVSEKLPEITFSSNRLRLWTLPLWYHVDLKVFNNLDKGLNVVSTKDDAYVQGFDFYQSLSHLMKFCDRYTLLTKVGLGVTVAERDDDSFNLDFPSNATFPYIYDGQIINGQLEGLTFVDKDTFLVGTKKLSLKDVDPAFIYGDIDSRFNARITDALSAWVRYRFRETSTDNSLGDFYSVMGSSKTPDDLFPFRLREHWIEAGLNYNLVYPRLTASLSAGKNLEGNDEYRANELIQYTNLNLGWNNKKGTLFANTGIGNQQRQMRDPSDANEYQQESLNTYVNASYRPIHGRWYVRGAGYFIDNQNTDPLYGSSGSNDLDTGNSMLFDFAVGRKIGTKYIVEYSGKYRTNTNSNSDTATGNNNDTQNKTDHFLRIGRDFHDVIAGVSFEVRDESGGNSSDNNNNDYQVKFDFKLKQAADKGAPPYLRTGELFNASKVGAFETGG